MKTLYLITDQISELKFNVKFIAIIQETDFTKDKTLLIDRQMWELQGCE